MSAPWVGVLTVGVLLVAAAVTSLCAPRLRPHAWFMARSAQLGVPPLVAVALAGGVGAALWASLAAAACALAAPAVTGHRQSVRQALMDGVWWWGTGTLTGAAASIVLPLSVPSAWLAVAVFGAALTGLLLELTSGQARTGLLGRRALEAGYLYAILSIAATAAALTVGVPGIGWWFVPLGVAPLVNVASALQARRRALRVEQETVTSLGRLPDVAGYTREGHAERVAEVASSIARAMGLPDGEVNTLRQAAILHDVGLVSLQTRIKDGSTSLLAPRDQQRVAARSAEIAAELPADEAVVDAVRHQAHSYNDHIMYRANVPRAARILKVANAVDDYAGGATTRPERERALHRVSMQQGYEFDPAVVAAAWQVLIRRDATAHGVTRAG